MRVKACKSCNEELLEVISGHLCDECREWQQVDDEWREDSPDIRDSYPMEYWTER